MRTGDIILTEVNHLPTGFVGIKILSSREWDGEGGEEENILSVVKQYSLRSR